MPFGSLRKKSKKKNDPSGASSSSSSSGGDDKDKEIERLRQQIQAKDKEIEELKKQNEELKKQVKAPGLAFDQKEAEKKEFFAGVTMKDKHGKVVKMKNKDNAGFFLTLALYLNIMKTGTLFEHTGPDPTPEQVVDEKRTNLGTQVSGAWMLRARAHAGCWGSGRRCAIMRTAIIL